MKQHITTDQLNELTPEAKEKLRGWWKPMVGDIVCGNDSYGDWVSFGPITKIDEEDGDNYIAIGTIEYCSTSREEFNEECYPLLSIGQMIEFLSDECYVFSIEKLEKNSDEIEYKWQFYSMGRLDPEGEGEELCDALWEAVKLILNEK